MNFPKQNSFNNDRFRTFANINLGRDLRVDSVSDGSQGQKTVDLTPAQKLQKVNELVVKLSTASDSDFWEIISDLNTLGATTEIIVNDGTMREVIVMFNGNKFTVCTHKKEDVHEETVTETKPAASTNSESSKDVTAQENKELADKAESAKTVQTEAPTSQYSEIEEAAKILQDVNIAVAVSSVEKQATYTNIGWKDSTKFSSSDTNLIDHNRGNYSKYYENIKDMLKSEFSRTNEKNALEKLGFDKMFDVSWKAALVDLTENGSLTIKEFTDAVIKHFAQLVENLAKNGSLIEIVKGPEKLEDAYIDLTSLTHYNRYNTAGGDDKIALKNGNNASASIDNDGNVKYENLKVTGGIAKNAGDSDDLNETLTDLLKLIKRKYPLDEKTLESVFLDAVNTVLKSYNNKTVTFKVLVDDIMEQFQLVLAKELSNAGGENIKIVEPAQSEQSKGLESPSDEVQTTVSTNAKAISDYIGENADWFDNLYSSVWNKAGNSSNVYNSKIKTDFGMDSDGKIQFEQKDTQKVYDSLLSTIKSELTNPRSAVKDQMKALGDDIINKLFQAAWIMTYNDYKSNDKNNAQEFMQKVVENFTKLMKIIAEKPELLSIITAHTAYADSSLTDGLVGYQTVEVEVIKNPFNGKQSEEKYENSVNYKSFYDNKNKVIKNDDSEDYENYNTTMTSLLERLKNKYSALVPEDTIAKLFEKAKQEALDACYNNKPDLPYGTGRGDLVSTDYTAGSGNFGDTRKGDNYNIDMDSLVQLTLYNFDKLLYAEILK